MARPIPSHHIPSRPPNQPISQRIQKIRPPIAQPLHLIVRLALRPPIPLALPPLRILTHQQKALQQATAKEEEGEVSEHGAVAGPEAGRVLAAVDVGGDHTVQVAPADDKAEGDAALVDALDVVGCPRDSVADAGVDAEGCEVDARVLDAGVGGTWGVVKRSSC